MAEINSLLSYARELSTQDREFYFNKLTLTNGVRLPDPCTINEWVEDVSKWPNIQWPDIYTYLIEKPSVYTREKLRAYKSLDDAYEYVVCGHVQNVKYHDMTRVLCGEIRILYYVLIPVNTFNRLQPQTPPVALKWL